MRIQLSTLLLLVGLLAVCIGWFTDRQRLTTELSELNKSRALRDEQVYTGSVTMGASGGKFDLLNAFDFDDVDDKLAHIKDDPEFRRLLSTECVTEFLNIYEHQAEVEIVGAMITGDWDARLDARNALYLLECDDTKQFFEIARSLEEFENPDYHPELHDTNSEEFKLLQRFVSDTIAIKDQMFYRGFDDDPRGK